MQPDDRTRWNDRYTQRGAASWTPDSFLGTLDALLPRTGRALDVAGGTGRHALWLARRGLDVTLIDVADKALAIATTQAAAEGLQLTTHQLDLTTSDLPAGPWDLVLDFHYLQRDLFPRFPEILSPGGVLVFVQPTLRNLERHAKPSARFLLEEGELARLVEGLDVLHTDEGWSEAGRHEASLVARKPAGG